MACKCSDCIEVGCHLNRLNVVAQDTATVKEESGTENTKEPAKQPATNATQNLLPSFPGNKCGGQ